MSDKTGSLWGCERIHGGPGGPEGPPGSNTVTHIFTGVLVPSFTIPIRVQPRTDNAVLGIGQVLPVRPYLTIPVANTETFPGGSVDSNNEVDFITYCEVLQTKAETLAEDLQTLYNEKIAAAIGSAGAGAGGGGVSEGVGNSCEEDFEIKANTFVINCNAMVVDQCGTPPPVDFNCGSFTITMDSAAETFTVTDGTSTISLNNGALTISGVSSIDLGSANLTTMGTITSQGKVLHSHTHPFSDSDTLSGSTGSADGTGSHSHSLGGTITISGNTSGPN